MNTITSIHMYCLILHCKLFKQPKLIWPVSSIFHAKLIYFVLYASFTQSVVKMPYCWQHWKIVRGQKLWCAVTQSTFWWVIRTGSIQHTNFSKFQFVFTSNTQIIYFTFKMFGKIVILKIFHFYIQANKLTFRVLNLHALSTSTPIWHIGAKIIVHEHSLQVLIFLQFLPFSTNWPRFQSNQWSNLPVVLNKIIRRKGRKENHTHFEIIQFYNLFD